MVYRVLDQRRLFWHTRFVFLNFLSCVKMTSVGLKLDTPRCTIGYCYIHYMFTMCSLYVHYILPNHLNFDRTTSPTFKYSKYLFVWISRWVLFVIRAGVAKTPKIKWLTSYKNETSQTFTRGLTVAKLGIFWITVISVNEKRQYLVTALPKLRKKPNFFRICIYFTVNRKINAYQILRSLST